MPDAISAGAASLNFQYGRFMIKANYNIIPSVSSLFSMSHNRWLSFRWTFLRPLEAEYNICLFRGILHHHDFNFI